MALQWHFRPKHRGDDNSDPITGEFFADGSLENPATALVREALQNALDAGKGIDRGGGPVRVRIGMYRGDHAASADAAARWFGSLRQHLQAPGNGLKDAPSPDDRCEYLVVEDFGTSGLTGDTESDDVDGQRNNFVDFLRSDGRTRKGEGDRGSWGVGKNVFPRSSRINGFIAYTVRHDDRRRMVMGKSILKIRRVGDEQYQPQCYLGDSWNVDEVPRPSEDAAIIARLRSDFRVERGDESGLSLVIPWVDPDVTYDDVLRAVVEQFYYAILNAGLTVTLANGSSEVTLDRENVVERVHAELPGDAPALDLARWSLTVRDDERFVLNPPPPNRPQQWSSDLVPDAVRKEVGERLIRRERVAIRVPLHVQESHGIPEPTRFDIYLEHHDENRQIRPSFFREQLAISGVKRAVAVPRIRALVVICDKPLASLLRLAEPPNHTDWDPKTANFRKVYRDGNHVITFVKSAVKQLLTIVRSGEDEPDPNVAIDFFALPEPDDRPAPPGGKRKKPKAVGDTDQEIEKPERKPRRFRVDLVEGGFVIRPGEPGTTPPKRINVAMAYDVMSGSPWKQYETADFDLTRKDRSGIQIAASGDVEFGVSEPNRIQLGLKGPDFEVYVTGFDLNRDLIVRAYDPKEPLDADPAAELHEAEEADA